jgi:phosphoribosylformylglycinamidine synthase
VFHDNAGVIAFNDRLDLVYKVETHNSPSALDPYGGAMTGIVGVNRDPMGTGQGAELLINVWGYCLGSPFSDDKDVPEGLLHPRRLRDGIHKGVIDGGNQSGIPYGLGWEYFEDRYLGKPLVYCGTVGTLPKRIGNVKGFEKSINSGDLIVMAGGRIGKDGIHGATFSSEELHKDSPTQAVQIGDPITQKKFSDALVKEIRDLGLYTAITDNGAGGLSSSVGEMGGDSGGFHVELEKVPLKYPGMQPWEIWISESQERMTLAVPDKNIAELQKLLQKRGVESWVIGEYTDSGRAFITWNGETVMDIAMDFLHDGVPETPLKTTFTRGGEPEPNLAEPKNYAQTMLDMLGRLNICSKEFVAAQYDHNVQGTAVLGPLQGPGRVYAEASVSRPVLGNKRGVVLSQGLTPRYSDIDTYHMATASLDMAVRNAVAAGCPIDHLAILDNFCWCSSEDPERLGQLKRACEAIYDMAVTYGTPFISGKDSMFNDFKGYDANDKPVTISIPPTLLVSGIGVMTDVAQAVSLDLKAVNDLVYILGETKEELGGSEYYAMHGFTGSSVPETNAKENLAIYKALSEANEKQLCASALSVGLGGVGVALAKKCIASGLGLSCMFDHNMRMDKKLFSESTGRILVSVAPEDQKAFEAIFDKAGVPFAQIATVMKEPVLRIGGDLELSVAAMEEAYKAPLRDF